MSSRAVTPFASDAPDLAAHGLALIPVGGEDGKNPLIRWKNMRRPLGRAALIKMAEQHGAENIGIVCGPSGLTVVDIDRADLLAAMLERFGPTPLVIETPSGGIHLFYKGAGERCANLRSEGLPVDIKGIGGFVVAPPSVRPNGRDAGKCYRIVKGSWDDLPRLTTIKPGSLPAARPAPRVGVAGDVLEGTRNNTMLKLLLREVKGCDSPDQILDAAHGMNQSFVPPMPDREVQRVAASAWDYEERGENWVGEESFVKVRRPEFGLLSHDPDALVMLIFLRLSHEGIRDEFAVSPKGIHKNGLLPGWGLHRIRGARDVLIREGFLNMIHEGGTKRGDAPQFRLATPAIAKGSISVPNTKKHPPLVNISSGKISSGHSARRRKTRYADDAVDLITLAGGESAPHRIAPEIFGARLREARQASGMTQATLAARVGVKRATLANVERAAYPAGWDLQKRIGEILGDIAA